MFGKEADFRAFQRVMVEAHRQHPVRILSYCVLSNHWHFVIQPEEEKGKLTASLFPSLAGGREGKLTASLFPSLIEADPEHGAGVGFEFLVDHPGVPEQNNE